MANESLLEKVTQINVQLRAFGREAVQEIKRMKDGEVIGRIRYGYKPQYVFDAVNNVLLPDVGDAYKGAIADALQKCFSLLSIGGDAYRGLLGSVYRSGACPPESEKQHAVQQSPQPSVQKLPAETANSNRDQPATLDLPEIAGIEYQRKKGIIVAVGKVYEQRDLLKSAGFQWDKTDNSWFKELAVH